jgi:hypothetical protein
MSEPEAWEPIVYPVVRQRASIFRQIVKRAEGGDTQIDPVLRLSHSRVAICDAYEASARTGCCCAGKACPLSCRPRLPSPAGRKLGEATRGSQRPGAHPDYVRGRLARVGVGKLGASSTRRRSPYSHSGDRFEVQRLMGEYARRRRCAVSCRISKPPAPPNGHLSEANYNAPSRPHVACLLLRTADMRVDRINHLVPMLAGGDDLIGVGGPGEGPVVVDLREKALDGGLEIDERAKHAALQPSPVSLAKKPSMAGIEPRGRPAYNGMCSADGGRASLLVGGVLSRIAWISLPAGTAGSIRFRNRWIPGGDGAPALANHLPVEHRK